MGGWECTGVEGGEKGEKDQHVQRFALKTEHMRTEGNCKNDPNIKKYVKSKRNLLMIKQKHHRVAYLFAFILA